MTGQDVLRGSDKEVADGALLARVAGGPSGVMIVVRGDQLLWQAASILSAASCTLIKPAGKALFMTCV